MIYYTNNPALDADRYFCDSQQKDIGECVQCGEKILCETEGRAGEEYVMTEDGPVHWECWMEYGYDKKERA